MSQNKNIDRDKIWDEFLKAWPIERVRTMTLEEYSQAKNRDTFTYWIEAGTQDLGSIWGGSAFKFGIYHMNPDRIEKEYKPGTPYKSDGDLIRLNFRTGSTFQLGELDDRRNTETLPQRPRWPKTIDRRTEAANCRNLGEKRFEWPRVLSAK
jgi:hypothetical protein